MHRMLLSALFVAGVLANAGAVGALWSAGFYALFAIALTDRCVEGTRCQRTRNPTAGDVALYAVAGTVPGALIGALIGRERWVRVTRGDQPRDAAR